MDFLWCNLALVSRHTKEVAHKMFNGSPSARICSTYLESLSQNSDSTGGEGAEDRCEVDLQAMEKYVASTSLSGHPLRPAGSSPP